MNKRTFDVIAKFVSDECGINVIISPDCDGPQMNIGKKTIWLPENIKEENAFSALATLMHEAAHMRYTTEIPERLVTNEIEHHILNAMEDVRIDKMNFYLLPNVQAFYKMMYKEHALKPDRLEKLKKAPMLTRILIHNILWQEGFHTMDKDTEAQEIGIRTGIDSLFYEGVNYLEMKQWDNAKTVIKEIIKKFEEDQNGKDPNGNGSGSGGNAQGTGQGNQEADCSGTQQAEEGASGESGEGTSAGDGRGQSSSDVSEEADSKAGSDDQSDKQEPECQSCDEFLHPASIWGRGSGLKGAGGTQFNVAELQESTRQKFIETLMIKEQRKIDDGTVLDTNNLIEFFTGNVKELFKEDIVEKKRKSKIIFALDSSGSMGCWLPIGQTSRSQALVNAVKALTEVLDEVRRVDGLEVDYEVCAFDNYLHRLNRDNWVEEYFQHSGGTWIWGAYDEAKKILLEDQEIDGNKMLILVTDGDVSVQEIDQIKEDIIKDNNDIRIMVVGVGADMTGRFVKAVIGDNNIISEELAEPVLIDAIQTMLE